MALLLPSVVFAFNAYISYRERGCTIYLASVIGPGPAVFIAYWIIALVAIVQALPLFRRPVVNST